MNDRALPVVQQDGTVAGSFTPSLFPLILNMVGCATAEEMNANVEATLARGYTSYMDLIDKAGTGDLSIVGSGPSLRETWGELRGDVLAINQAIGYLLDNGIVPRWAMLWDASQLVEQFAVPHPDVTYLMASHCHPENFRRLLAGGARVVLWHAQASAGEEPIIYRDNKRTGRQSLMVCGASLVALRAFSLVLGLGYRTIHTFGYDACWGPDGQSHAYYDRPHVTFEVHCAGRTFVTNALMARKAQEFGLLIRASGHLFNLRTHGDGLIQHIHRTLCPGLYEGEAA